MKHRLPTHAHALLAGALIFLPTAAIHAQEVTGTPAPDTSSTGVAPQAPSTAAASGDTGPVPVGATPPAGGTPPGVAPSSAQQLEEVVVTATKRAKSARDIPVSISAIKGADLEKQGARNIKDYVMEVPGLTLQQDQNGEAGGTSFTIRGVGSFSTGGNQTVGQFIGDVPMTDPVGNKFTPDLDPFDLASVEVLKGPQGTAFGGTALNGAIRYVPDAPVLGEWEARGFSEGSNVDGRTGNVFGLVANLPLGSRLAFRGTGVISHAAGVYENELRNDADSSHKWGGRAQALWQVTDGFKINLLYLKQHTRINDILYADNPTTYTNAGKPGPSPGQTDFGLLNVDARYTLGSWGTVVYQGGYQRKRAILDEDATLITVTGEADIQTTRSYANYNIIGRTHELRWVSPDSGNWNWIVGFFYENYVGVDINNVYAADTSALGTLLNPLTNYTGDFTAEGLDVYGTNTLEKATEVSGFGELTRKLFNKKVEITVGARRYDTQLHANLVSSGAIGPAADTGATNGPIHQGDQGVDPKISVSWKPNHNLMIYALVSKGFQFGGVNSIPLFSFENPVEATYPTSFKSSSLWNRELGIRTDWFHRTLRIDLTGFDIDWSNAQVTQDGANGHIIGSTYTENVGKVRSDGVETSVSWLTPLPGLRIIANAAYDYARTAITFDSDGVTYNPGTLLPNTPRVQTSTTLAYKAHVGAWVGDASFSHTYYSKAFAGLDHQFKIDSYGLFAVNASVERANVPGEPALTFGVTNLFNHRADVAEFGGGTSGYAASVNQLITGTGYLFTKPRTLTLRFSLNF